MPAPKSAASTATKGGPKAKTASSSGTATPVSTSAEKDTLDVSAIATLSGGKPDKKAYDAQQESIKKEIDALQVKLSAVRDKINLASGNSGPGNDRRKELRDELESIRGQQSQNKQSRGKVFEQMKALQENVQKKIKDLQAAKAKIPFKTVAEVEAHIKHLEKQVESGSMKLAEEKRALNDINVAKRSRRAVEGFQADQEAIEADRQKIDELKKQLDDPGRKKLFRERDELQAKHNELWDKKRASSAAGEQSASVTQRLADEQAKKKEIADRLLDEAQTPAFQFQIEDCQTLIDSLSGKSTGNVTFKSTPDAQEIAGVPKLEVRKVEAEVPEGIIVRKKKGEDDDAYFVAAKRNKGGNGNKKGAASKAAPVVEAPATPAAPSSSNLQIPLPTLSALLSLSIPPPANSADVPRVVEDLKTKKAWFEANQDRVTAENIAKANARIQKLDEKATEASPADAPASPAEPTVDAAEARIDA
ncbi:nuclear segregation protein Bfr1 [Ephemerocybe angulata]|uniref:Nuclear segregation protein Bfr1 n=1 Tax=Ephemerocybe angulata TaxID=980116 RepID=A0A8H6IAW7_9AGAR|nr:nuclear segregation protein Bfr1 [Tulosesus angulatus]